MSPSEAPIGFRLAHELEGLLHGIAADGHVSKEEQERLRRWLDVNTSFRHLQPFRELAAHVERALADGRLEPSEVEELLFVISKLTTVNPYFDTCRAGLQVLTGLLAGVSADRTINDREIASLNAWMADWAHICGVWPFTECEAVVTRVLAHGDAESGHSQLLALAAQLPVGDVSSAGEDLPLVVGALCAVAPDVQFDGRTFVFTGESQKAGRDTLASHVTQRGATVDENVTRRTDYLVVCHGGNPLWAFSCYGRKIEKAYGLRRKGHSLLIIEERDFWDAL
jgi:hypothetical protein